MIVKTTCAAIPDFNDSLMSRLQGVWRDHGVLILKMRTSVKSVAVVKDNISSSQAINLHHACQGWAIAGRNEYNSAHLCSYGKSQTQSRLGIAQFTQRDVLLLILPGSNKSKSW